MPERQGSFNVFGAPTLRDVKVGYISTETGYVSGVGLWDANVYAKKNPGTTFIFNNRDGTRYLNINEVNKLTVDDLPRGNDPCGGANILTKDDEDKDPKIIFSGGGGVGAQANPVIGQDGSLLGVHLVSGGFGYKYPPQVSVEDPTGYAAGVVVRAGIGSTVTTYQTYEDEEDFENYFPPHVMELAPPIVGYGVEFSEGKNIGAWNPNKYINPQETPFEQTVKNYMKELRGVQSPWWTTHEAPSKVTGDNRTTKTFYKVHHWAWGAKTGTNDEIDNLYIKLFGRRGEPSGLAYWKNLRESGESLAVIEQDMKRQPEWKKVQEEGKPVMSDVTYKFGTYWEFDKENFMNSYAISPVPMSKSKGSDFSGRWYTFEWDDVEFPYDGEYIFRVQCDNEARFFFDNEAVSDFKIGRGGAAGSVLSNPLTFRVSTGKGKHRLKLELYNHPKLEDITVQGDQISTRQEIQVAGGDFILKSNGYHLAVGGNEETELVLSLEYNDNPKTAGTAVTKITIPNPNGPDLVLEREKDSNGNFKTKGSVSAKGVFKRSEFGYGPFIVEGNSGSTKLVRQNLTYGVNSVKYGQIDFLDSHGSDTNGSLKLVSAKNLQESRTIIKAPTSSESTKLKTIFNTVDYINKANRKLWRINSGSGQGFINDYGICPFDTTITLPDNPYAGTHEIRWNNVNFPISGNYIIEIAVDDNVNLRIGDEVEIRKEGFTIVKGRYRSTGKLREVHYIKEGTYNIFAGLEQIPGGKFGFGKGLNPMALAINITTVFTKEERVAKLDWNKNPMGVAMIIDAPNPPVPQEPKPVQEGRCPPNPFWTTRFAGGTVQWHPVYVDGWGPFLNKYAMSPVPPYDIDSTSGGGTPFENEWTVDIPYDGFYKLKGSADDNSQFYIDGKLELETKRSGKVKDETMVFLNEGPSKIKVVVENYLFEERNLIDQKIFNAADWVDAGEGSLAKTVDVDFKVTTNTALINSIDIKGLFYEQGPKLIAGKVTPPPQIKPAVDANVEFIKRGGDYFMAVTGNDLVEVGFDFRYVALPSPPDPVPVAATMKFVKKSGKYFLQVTGNYLVDVALEFRYHVDDPKRGGGDAVTSITVRTEGAPLTFTKSDGPRMLLDGWPGRGGVVIQNGTFINGREYEVTFSTISGAPDPVIGPAGSLDNTSSSGPDKRINFFDRDTSGGATSGPDLDGDVRAYFSTNSITQLSDPPIPSFDPPPIAVSHIIIQTEDTPLSFRRTDGPRDLSGWPFRGGSVTKKGTFKSGKEYPITTKRLAGAADPIIDAAGSLDNVSREIPGRRINFFDLDTSGGATAGADSFGDTRAHFTANSVKQLSEPEVETFDPVEETQLRQLDGKKGIIRRVEIGKEYIVEIKNAGQGLMGNYPAPLAALKTDGGVLMVEDIPNVPAEQQGGVTFDDLVCTASHGKFYDIKGNICKFKVDSSVASVKVQKDAVTYDGPKLYRYAFKGYGQFMKKSGVAPDYPVGGSGQVINYVWSNVDFPADDTYKFLFAHDAHGSVYLDGKEIIIGDFDTIAGVSARDEANWKTGITKMIKVTKGKHVVAVAPSFGNLGKTNIAADGLFKKLSADYYRGQQAWFNNPSGMALSITRKVDVNVAAGRKPKHKSWAENPMGVSGILIPPPCPNVVGGAGVVDEVIPISPGNGWEPPTGPGYPVGIKLKEIIIDTPGINYNPDDAVDIGNNGGGTKAHICEMDSYGRIKKICIDDDTVGVGITGYPRVTIDSPTGSGFRGVPVVEVVPDPVDPGLDRDKLLQVTDLVGVKQTGYYDGRAYYGAIFYKDGVKYAGYYETAGQLVQIYDTLQESIDAQVTTPASAILRQGTDISSDNPRLDIPGTPDNLT